MKEFIFENKNDFLNKLKELATSYSTDKIEIFTPFEIKEVEKILNTKESKLKYFAGGGAILGLISGFALTIYTSMDYPLIVGGKPIISIPAFIIIAFELLILFGGVISFIGFLILAGLPNKNLFSIRKDVNNFVIKVKTDE